MQTSNVFVSQAEHNEPSGKFRIAGSAKLDKDPLMALDFVGQFNMDSDQPDSLLQLVQGTMIGQIGFSLKCGGEAHQISQ